jgi:ribosomal 50S subunit-recycling heat shock protein
VKKDGSRARKRQKVEENDKLVLRYCRSIIVWQVLEHGRSEGIRLYHPFIYPDPADHGVRWIGEKL